MKKLLLAGLLSASSFIAAQAQKANIIYSNFSAYGVNRVFLGDVGATCTPALTTTPYTMGAPASPIPASTLSWIGSTGNYVNAIRFYYMVGGLPVSAVDFPICSVATGSYPIAFPGGPTVTLIFGQDPTTCSFDVYP